MRRSNHRDKCRSRSSPRYQPSAYHVMSDQGTFLGVPNCLNVLSNLPFALVGLLGLGATFSHSTVRAPRFLEPWERWSYAALFVGVTLNDARFRQPPHGPPR